MENSSINRLDLDEDALQNKGIDFERIRNAKKRRILQLKRWAHYDKSKEKEAINRQRKGFPLSRKGPKSVRFCQNLILLEAGNSGDADEVRRLLSEGVCADVANSDGLTALHQCAINKNIEMCRILIHYKANVNAKDKELWTPLHAAAICGHSDICQLLIKNGADLMALNTDGNMPYDICEDEVTLDIIENEMAAKGITQEQINVARNLPEQYMLNDLKAAVGRLGQSGAVQLFSQLDRQGANQLHIAAACGYVDVTRFLVSIGMAIDGLDKDGWQPIHVASLHSHLEVIEILVTNGANIDSQTKQGETVYELVYDGDVYEKLLLLKQEVDKLRENQSLTSSIQLVRRRSSTNPRSASIRRTSMKEKSFLSWKEARLEAEIRLSLERKKPQTENNITSPVNHVQEQGDKNNRDTFVNSSMRASHKVEPILEADGEQLNLDPSQVELDIHDSSKVWLPGLANKTDKPNFTHSHPYNSPTRDPITFPYNPGNSKPVREPLPRLAEPSGRQHESSSRSSESSGRHRDEPKARMSGEKPAVSKKTTTLPHTHQQDPPDGSVIDARPLLVRPGKGQAKSPSTSHKQLATAASRSSVNSVKTGSSSHTTPIGTPRSSQLSTEHRKPTTATSNRHPIKSVANPNKGTKSIKQESCCSLM